MISREHRGAGELVPLGAVRGDQVESIGIDSLYSSARVTQRPWHRRVKITWSGDTIDYIGYHKEANAATSAGGWEVFKLTWSGENVTDVQGPLIGVYDDKASLGWT